MKSVFASMLLTAASVGAQGATVTINDPAISSGYQPSYYSAPADYAQETIILGVYETRSDHSGSNHPVGIAHVHVNGTSSTPVNLVLSSYEPTNWILDGSGLSFVNVVLTNGYQTQTVSGISASKVVDFSGYPEPYLSACAYKWPSSTGGCDTPALVNAVQSYFGFPVSEFAGVYRATDFTITLAPVPEPVSGALMFSGLVLVGTLARKRKAS